MGAQGGSEAGVLRLPTAAQTASALSTACHYPRQLQVQAGRESWHSLCVSSECLVPFLQVHELAAQGTMAALLLLSGNWFTGACHAALLAYMFQLYSSRRIYVDTTDAFRQLPQQKMQRGIILGAHLALFVLVVYRCVSRHVDCRNVQQGSN